MASPVACRVSQIGAVDRTRERDRSEGRCPAVSVVVPTFCEAENLRVLVPRLFDVLAHEGLSAEVIVVDDDSPDATRAVCHQLGELFPLRLVIRRKERGLSSAVVHGLKLAQGDALVVMDADLSHPPEVVPQLVAALRDPDVDFVLGSRYIAGGSTEDDWGRLRRLNSRAATLMARLLTHASDPMAGFFALRRDLFVEHAANLNPIGYKIALECLVKCGCRNVAEIPIRFRNRLHGESKLSLREQWNYLRHVARLLKYKYPNVTSFLQFSLVGLSGAVVDLLLFAALLWMVPVAAARALAIWGAMTWNFLLNRHWTFSATRAHPWGRQYVLFCAACAAGALLNWSVSLSLIELVPTFTARPLPAAALGVLAGFLSNFCLCRRLAFATKTENDSAPTVE